MDIRPTYLAPRYHCEQEVCGAQLLPFVVTSRFWSGMTWVISLLGFKLYSVQTTKNRCSVVGFGVNVRGISVLAMWTVSLRGYWITRRCVCDEVSRLGSAEVKRIDPAVTGTVPWGVPQTE